MLQSLKSVLVGVTADRAEEAPSAALGYALGLAGAAGAHLTLQAAALKLVMPPTVVSGFGAGFVAAENRRLHALAEAVAERARGEAQAAGVACTVETADLTYAELVGALMAQARVHDLCVLDAKEGPIDLDRDLMEAILTGSGRPVIVVPPGAAGFRAGRILVAWDGSGRAARAVADAMPLLRAAESVEIVAVTGEKDLSSLVPGAELAPHLARHGVNVAVTVVPAEEGDVAETLRAHARRSGADLVVMGAYVHSRLREWLFGGVTRSLLGASPVPVLMSH
jgi:nucleotide-binding universal stress UspA family protein